MGLTSIVTGIIEDQAVTTEKIADRAVTGQKLQFNIISHEYSLPVASGEVITEGDIVKLVNGEIASLHNPNIDAVGVAEVFESASTYYPSVTSLSSNKAIVTYRDDDNSNYGTACVLQSDSGLSDIIGIAKESKTGGQLCKIADLSKSLYITELSGLTEGATYCCGSNGKLVEGYNTPPQPAHQIFSADYIAGEGEDSTTLKVIGIDNVWESS